MDIRSFEDLEVFQRAYRLSLEIHRKSLQMPAHEQHGLADQLRRASKSICVNVAEGFAKLRLLGTGVQTVLADGDRIRR